ncbi:hypothetical protein [Gimesia alba]|nr:hypothetical protein [Gimesia alba]
MNCSRGRLAGAFICSDVSKNAFEALRKMTIWGWDVVSRQEKHQKSLGFRGVNFNRCEKEQVKIVFLSRARRYLRMLGRGSEESRRKKSPEIRAEMSILKNNENVKLFQDFRMCATSATENSALFFGDQLLCFGNTVAWFAHFVLL